MAFDSKKQNLRLLSQMKKPRWWPKVSAAKQECFSDRHSSDGRRDPNLQLTQEETVTLNSEGRCETGNHLPALSCVGTEEEFPSVTYQTHNSSWLYHPGQALFVLIGEKLEIK